MVLWSDSSRRLKESLIALGSEEPNDWYWRLPCSLLSIRTTLKPDIGASPADMVFGEGLAVPGTLLPTQPPTEDEEAETHPDLLNNLRLEVARLQPTKTSAHRRPRVHIPDELRTATHVLVRRAGVQPSLRAPYSGPYRVIARQESSFRIALPGGRPENVSISRLKPAVVATDEDDLDLTPPSPPSPRPPGRAPRRPNRPTPTTTRRTRSSTRSQVGPTTNDNADHQLNISGDSDNEPIQDVASETPEILIQAQSPPIQRTRRRGTPHIADFNVPQQTSTEVQDPPLSPEAAPPSSAPPKPPNTATHEPPTERHGPTPRRFTSKKERIFSDRGGPIPTSLKMDNPASDGQQQQPPGAHTFSKPRPGNFSFRPNISYAASLAAVLKRYTN